MPDSNDETGGLFGEIYRKHGDYIVAIVALIAILIIINAILTRYKKNCPTLKWQILRQAEIVDCFVELNSGWGKEGRPAYRKRIHAGREPQVL